MPLVCLLKMRTSHSVQFPWTSWIKKISLRWLNIYGLQSRRAERLPVQLFRRSMLHQVYGATLIPQPTLPKLPTSFVPLTPIQANKAEDGGVEVACLPEQIPCDSPKDQRNRSKKLSSALRRSLHKKINMKSPMQPPLRRIGVNVGMEKVRVSIGGRGKLGQRVLLGNARRAVKDVQQKQSHREKERGWNIGTTSARTLV